MVANIILASGSSARNMMLKNAGVEFDVVPADIDERFIAGRAQGEVSLMLAKEKALSVSREYSDAIVIGSDQVLVKDKVVYNKAQSKKEAFDRLKEFQGKEHSLVSSVCVFQAENILWHHTGKVCLKMREMSDQSIQQYIQDAGNVVTQCVGCYAIEGLGIRLFDKIEGDYFSILGMPLLPLLNYLEREGHIT